MSDPQLVTFLRSLPHFGQLEPDLIERLAGGCRRREVAAGAVLFHAGAPCEAFHAILSGRVRLVRAAPDGREQVVQHLGPGASFAEAALLSFGVYPVTAIATEASELVEVPGSVFLGMLRDEAGMATAVISSLCMRLMGLVERVEELSLIQAGARLARWVLRQPARGQEGRIEIDLELSKKELAAHLAMAPETLSRVLRLWQDQGWVESERSRLVLLSSAPLVELADGPPGPP